MTGALIRNIRALRRPVVAAVNGTAVGAGAVIALACDFRLATSDVELAYTASWEVEHTAGALIRDGQLIEFSASVGPW